MSIPDFPLHSNPKLGYNSKVYSDPAWTYATVDEIMESPVIQYQAQAHRCGIKPDDQRYEQVVPFYLKCFRESLDFYRNAKLIISKPKILRNTICMKIPGPTAEGFSFSPGLTAKHGRHSIPIMMKYGLCSTKYYQNIWLVNGVRHPYPPAFGPNYNYFIGGTEILTLISTAAKINVNSIQNQANDLIDRLILSAPSMLNQYLEKHSGNSKIAQQLSKLVFKNGWYDQDPHLLYRVLMFCKNNTQGIRDFSTWVRTHKAQINLLDEEAVKQAVSLASVMSVNKE